MSQPDPESQTPPKRPASKKHQLYNDLQRRILTMQLAPGENLDETSLSNEYGISRTPLREVFRRLAGEGYLELRPNRGAFVALMTYQNMENFFETAPVIYALSGRMAARNASPAQIEELRAIQVELRRVVEASCVEGAMFWNDRFHAMIGEMANNPYLMPSLKRLLIDHTRVGRTFWNTRSADMLQRVRTAVEQHDRMIQLIAAGDEEGMVQISHEHWKLSSDRIDSFVQAGW